MTEIVVKTGILHNQVFFRIGVQGFYLDELHTRDDPPEEKERMAVWQLDMLNTAFRAAGLNPVHGINPHNNDDINQPEERPDPAGRA
jgi:hypothetical protein